MSDHDPSLDSRRINRQTYSYRKLLVSALVAQMHDPPGVGTNVAPVTGAAMPKLGSADKAAVPRVGYLVYRVERRLRARLDEEMRVHGVSTPEYVTLSLLRERDGLSCAQLARWALVTPQAMNLVISGLERRRLVRRRPDPKHRRVLRASVTAKGLEVLARCDRSMDGIEADMLGDLPPDTVELVRTAMASFAHSLAATNPPPRPRPLSSRGGSR
jgi:DNA-binding MarR family transcriptional regulator